MKALSCLGQHRPDNHRFFFSTGMHDLPSGFIEPCLPSKAARPPSGPLWVHEIKHDGYRLMVPREDVDALIDGICGVTLKHLFGMSARCSRDMQVRRANDAVVDQIRREMAAAYLAKADEWNEPPLDEQWATSLRLSASSVTDCGICRKRSRCRAND
jgi:hypothetical protein